MSMVPTSGSQQTHLSWFVDPFVFKCVLSTKHKRFLGGQWLIVSPGQARNHWTFGNRKHVFQTLELIMFGSYNMWSLSEHINPQIHANRAKFNNLSSVALTCFDHVGVSRHLETHPLHHFWLHTLSCYIPLHPIIVIFWLNNLIPHDFVAGWIPFLFWLDLNFSESAESPFNHNQSIFLAKLYLTKIHKHPIFTGEFPKKSWRNPTKKIFFSVLIHEDHGASSRSTHHLGFTQKTSRSYGYMICKWY